MFLYRLHYPMVVDISGKSFMDAAKRFVKANRQFNINQLIMSDQYNRYKRAVVRQYIKNGLRRAEIRCQSYKQMRNPLLNVNVNNVNRLNRYNPVVGFQQKGAPWAMVAPGFGINTVGMGPANAPFIMRSN